MGTIRAQQGKLDEAEVLLTHAAKNDPTFVPVHMNLAHLYLLKGEPRKTIAELREVLRLDPANSEAVEKLATLLLSEGEIDECVSFVERAKQSQPLSAALLVLLGDAYLKKGNAGKAEEIHQHHARGPDHLSRRPILSRTEHLGNVAKNISRPLLRIHHNHRMDRARLGPA